jgi:hypothetical protein
VKYTTFRNVIVLGGLASVAVGGFYFMSRPRVEPASVIAAPVPTPSLPEPVRPTESRQALPSQIPVAAASAPAPAAEPPKPVKASDASKERTPLRPLDEEVLRLAGSRVAGDKVKDALPGRPYKINLYAEGGRVVRAKVDLNRNEKWDEKWSFELEGGQPVVKRQVSPADDDTTYTLKYRIIDRAWVPED